MASDVGAVYQTLVKANIMKMNVTLLGRKSVLGFPSFIYLNLSEEVWWFPDCDVMYWTNDKKHQITNTPCIEGSPQLIFLDEYEEPGHNLKKAANVCICEV